jgi:poly(A) polymerase/tRNA nucleotidyltransferase (CCA-adding enzyme)
MVALEAWERAILERGALYLVGGSVRDQLLIGRSKDRDYLVTGIAADELASLLRGFGRVVIVGRSFGVLRFHPEGRDEPVDIALPRRERSTGTGHRDFFVDFDPGIPVEVDLGRRDFTMNAIARRIPSGELIDPFGGRDDIEARRLRLVFPNAFREDPLRMLRAVQFAARFELAVEEATRNALHADAALAATISAERIGDEITKLLTLAERPSVGLRLAFETGLLAVVLPELAKTAGVEQPREWHLHDVFTHSLLVCDATPKENLALRLAALFHDTGKADRRQVIPDEATGGTRVVFYGHEEVSRADAAAALERLRFPRALAERVDVLIACHMFDYRSEWSDAAVRRLIARAGRSAIADLIALRRADQLGSGVPRDLAATDELEARVQAELARESATTTRDLAVDGTDVMEALRCGPGPAVGRALARLLEEVLDDPSKNEREALLARLRALRAEGAA